MKKQLAEEVKKPVVAKTSEAKTKEELLLEKYKEQSPVKYAAKLAAGQFKNFKLVAAILLAISFGVVAVGGAVKAYQSFGDGPKVVVEGDYIEAGTQPVASEEVLGAMASPDISSNWLSVNGDNTYHIVAPLDTASSKLVVFANPFGTSANATVEMVRIQMTGAATTSDSIAEIFCGAATSSAGVIGLTLLDTADFYASTTVNFLAENNLTSALGATVDGGTVAKIALNSTYPYFVCNASSTYAGTYTNSTVVGKATVRVSKTR